MTAYTIPRAQTISQDVAARKAARRKIIEKAQRVERESYKAMMERKRQLQARSKTYSQNSGMIRKHALIFSFLPFIPIRVVVSEQEHIMKQSEEEIVTALHILFAKVETLRQTNIRDILKPDVYSHYEHTLQEAYDALTTVEDALTALGMKLEYQHYRLGGAVDELTPLMIVPRSKVDMVMEEFQKRLL